MIKEHQKQYFELFYKIKGVDKGDKEAYYLTEEQWVENHGFNKYSSYESFRVRKSEYLRKLLRFVTHKNNK